ncbi:hypothetical protein ICN32_10650 [Polynucleobacter wuianus]|uniref:5-methylcytosine restriction system specificity protein McrC n=1 Tax=Polynucleobacter wuianus TaxID=1743168 RepID=UPI001C0BC307|nr:McrC family protein [Polynucleobacter wuianus]MBU3611012.1 hypothetical protein [Polynucleobacter wuianus]
MINAKDNFDGPIKGNLAQRETHISISMADIQNNPGVAFFSFYSDENKREYKNSPEDLVIKTSRVISDDGFIDHIKTGNYIGSLKWGGVDINITSRFGEQFLKRMLNFSNGIYISDLDSYSEKNDKANSSKFILHYLFLQSLEKAFLLGLPKAYKNINHNEAVLKGRLDLNKYIKHSIPYLGKLPSISREQRDVQEFVDIFYKAYSIVESESQSNAAKKMKDIKSYLRVNRSPLLVTAGTISKAKSSKAFFNPIYSSYRGVLNLAEMIIKLDSLKKSDSSGSHNYSGFLINVAELFEIYITEILRNNFNNWEIDSPKILLYDGRFYRRYIIPDIVMRQKDRVIVLDTKYKRMVYRGRSRAGAGDLDRDDFFQINTYMAYFKQSGEELLGGGLLYPLSKYIEVRESHSPNWFGGKSTFFVVDGILAEGDIVANEQDFIGRIGNLIQQSQVTNPQADTVI